MFIIKRATTGRVGNETYDNRVIDLREYPTREEALAEMRARRSEYAKTGVEAEGSDGDYTVVLKDEHFDCTDRYWVEEV
jgi:hypothetical protein